MRVLKMGHHEENKLYSIECDCCHSILEVTKAEGKYCSYLNEDYWQYICPVCGHVFTCAPEDFKKVSYIEEGC